MFRVLDADSPISKEDFLQFEEILGKKLPGVYTMIVISFLSIPLIHLMR